MPSLAAESVHKDGLSATFPAALVFHFTGPGAGPTTERMKSNQWISQETVPQARGRGGGGDGDTHDYSILGLGGRRESVPPRTRSLWERWVWADMGGSNLGGFLGDSRCRVLAVCDVDHGHLVEAQKRVDNHYNNQDCAAYNDFRELSWPATTLT